LIIVHKGKDLGWMADRLPFEWVQGKKDVTLRRMSRESIDDQVTMFELFTNVKEISDGDEEVVASVDACMKHWTAMARESQGSEAALLLNFRKIQEACNVDVEELEEGLKRMREFVKDRQLIQDLCDSALGGVESGLKELTTLRDEVAETRVHILGKAQTCIRRERQAAMESAQREVARCKRDAQVQQDKLAASQQALARELQESKAELQRESKKLQNLLADLKVKASQLSSLQGELEAKQIELDKHRKDLSGLSERDARLEASLGEKQEYISSLLTGKSERSFQSRRDEHFPR